MQVMFYVPGGEGEGEVGKTGKDEAGKYISICLLPNYTREVVHVEGDYKYKNVSNVMLQCYIWGIPLTVVSEVAFNSSLGLNWGVVYY